MQVKKDSTRSQILSSAEKIFLRDGYSKANMRDIADEACVSLGNLYNYFSCKDDLFRSIVAPAVADMEAFLMNHHDEKNLDLFKSYIEGDADELISLQTERYMNLLKKHRKGLELLLTKAQGSSLERFKDDFTDECTKKVIEYMELTSKRYPSFKTEFHPFTYHVQTVWMFVTLEEIIKHRLSYKDTKKVIQEYIKFEYDGWRDLFTS
ncbi:MAG: TetR/AcrR family transcriptional regulator [Bacteroidales bacterium]|nr:TetR/AcrR family transcriptional regulator [Bacteroidales bacterium]